ncbi:MAG TPA: hypothetical protein DD791_05195 [Syntrophomonas sp.]|jgi:hypothetical protein|nr:hypothetical protein [Syntrophomonas sp.]
MSKILKNSWKRLIMTVLTVAFLATPAGTGFVIANMAVSPSKQISIPENNKDIDVLLEIVYSDLEEKVVINKDGTVSNYYSSADKAGVSKEAFKEFESLLVNINKEVRAGNITFGEGLFDAEIHGPKIAPNFAPGVIFCFTNSQVSQALKLIQAGAALATIASVLGAPVGVAAAFLALYAAGDLCNWCDQGFCIMKLPTPGWACIPIC